ncbi:Cell division control protein 3 [Leucoagaricus gongylophorus]
MAIPKRKNRSRSQLSWSLLLPKPKLDIVYATAAAKQDQRINQPTSFLPPIDLNLKMSDPYVSAQDVNVNHNGFPHGSDVSFGQAPTVPIIRKKLMGYVGFANLPNQVHRKSVRKGFQFTAMVVGESGLGKSTLINTLFSTTLYPPKVPLAPAEERPKTVAIESIGADIEESGVRLHLTVVDTPGFGDFVNNDDSWRPIVENIESRFDSYLEQENRVNRSKIADNRIHACLYFIQATGHSLKQLDIEVMRRLHTKVNLIPIIAKADTLTDVEVLQFKQRVLSDIAYHNIQIFQAPTYENEDEETIAEAEEIAGKIPFAVVGSDRFIDTADGRSVRGRAYPWGIVEVDNEEHCDFVKLRQMLVRTYMEELREYTNDVLYENWRTEKLLSMGVAQDSSVFKEINPAARLQEERVMHEAKLSKMEAEMKMVFQQKVQEKEAKLKQSEEELYARHKEMRDALEKQRADLEEKKRRLESGRPLTPEKGSTQRKKGFLRT